MGGHGNEAVAERHHGVVVEHRDGCRSLALTAAGVWTSSRYESTLSRALSGDRGHRHLVATDLVPSLPPACAGPGSESRRGRLEGHAGSPRTSPSLA